MFEFTVAYVLLVLMVTVLLVFMLKTGLWREYFLFFVSLAAFALFNVYGLYALSHSIAFRPPDFVNFSRVFIAFFLVIISFYIMLPVYGAVGPSRFALCWSTATTDTEEKRSGTTTVCLLWCFCVVVIAYYFATTGTRPLLVDLFEGRLSGLSHMDLEVERWRRGWFDIHWFAPAFYQIPTFLALYTYTLRHLFPTKKHSLLFWLSLVTAAVLSVTFLSKGNIVFLFTGLAMAAILRQSRFRARILLILGPGLAVAFWLYIVFFSTANLSTIDLLKLMWHRIVEAYSMAAGVILSLFPEHLPFFNGTTINNPGGLLPYDHVDLSFIVYEYIYGVRHGGATFGAVWEGYANFGYLGLVTFAILVQLLVFGLHLGFRVLRKTAFTFALFVYLSLQVLNIWANSMFYTLLNPPFLLTVFVLVAVRYGVMGLLGYAKGTREMHRVPSTGSRLL